LTSPQPHSDKIYYYNIITDKGTVPGIYPQGKGVFRLMLYIFQSSCALELTFSGLMVIQGFTVDLYGCAEL
jgi:hypothetical protein